VPIPLAPLPAGASLPACITHCLQRYLRNTCLPYSTLLLLGAVPLGVPAIVIFCRHLLLSLNVLIGISFCTCCHGTPAASFLSATCANRAILGWAAAGYTAILPGADTCTDMPLTISTYHYRFHHHAVTAALPEPADPFTDWVACLQVPPVTTSPPGRDGRNFRCHF